MIDTTGHDLRWSDIVSFAAKDIVAPVCDNQTLHEVADSFFNSVGRITSMLLMPSFVGDLTMNVQRAFDIAELEITGGLRSDTLELTNHPKAEDISQAGEKHFSQGVRTRASKDVGDAKRSFLRSISLGTKPVLLLSNTSTRTTLESLLSSATILLWTSFETMASDLWEAALNTHPSGLSELKGIRSRIIRLNRGIPEDKYESSSEHPRQDRKVSLSEIVRYSYKIADKMGSVLKPEMHFESLDGTREAYAIAFHAKSNQIDEALSDKSLDCLCAIRNLLVHRAGKVDAIYAKKTKHLAVPNAAVGEHIKIDGHSTAALFRDTLTAARKLISGVDTWITEN